MHENDDELVLSSSASMKVSLEAIRAGKAGLDSHRQVMLMRTPDPGDWASFGHKTLNLKDLAYLTAQTGDEFAILRGKKEDVLVHGNKTRVTFVGVLHDMLIEHKLELVGHSHPGEDEPEASPEDRAVLRLIGQKRSYVVSGRTGIINDFSFDPFE